MATQPETKLQQRIRKALLHEFGGWWVKIHVSEFDEAGLPDLFGFVDGLGFALEVKRSPPNYEEPTELQLETMRRIRERGKAISCVVTSTEEALNIVGEALGK